MTRSLHHLQCWVVLIFKNCTSHFFIITLQLYNLSTDYARDLFQPSRCSKSASLQWKKLKVLNFAFFVGDVIGGVHFQAILAQVTWPWAPTAGVDILTQVFIWNWAITWVFWALDWLSRVFGSTVMAKKRLNF